MWQRVPARLIFVKSLEMELKLLLLYSMLYLLASYLIAVLIQQYPLPILGSIHFVQDVWYSLVFKVLLLAVIPFIVYFRYWRYTLEDLLLGVRSSIRMIAAAIFLVLVGFLLNAGHLGPIQRGIGHLNDKALRLALGICMPLVVAAIPEEFFFRGVLQTRLERKCSRVTAVVVSSLFFTAWHLPSRYLLSSGVEGKAGDFGDVLLHTGVPVFIAGVFFGLHWSRYRNIIVLVLTHWAVDILPSVSSYLKIRF